MRRRLQQKFSEQPHREAAEITTNVRDKEFMEKVVHAIEERIVDPQLTVEELGRVLSMSRSHLHKNLKAIILKFYLYLPTTHTCMNV